MNPTRRDKREKGEKEEERVMDAGLFNHDAGRDGGCCGRRMWMMAKGRITVKRDKDRRVGVAIGGGFLEDPLSSDDFLAGTVLQGTPSLVAA